MIFKTKSEFTRNVLTLMTGTTIAQAIPFAISPILTRIYSPEDFGIFALYLSILGLISVIVTGRYEIAIVLPTSEKEAINILFLSLIITCFMTIITTVLIFFFKSGILTLFDAMNLGNLIYLIPISLFLSGLYQSFNYWSNRKKYYKNMANSRISQSIGAGIGQLSFSFFFLNAGMILGNILGRILSVATLLRKFLTNDKYLLKEFNIKIVFKMMKEYKDFPLVNSFHVFSDVVKTSSSTMLISLFFGNYILGFYALSLRVLQVPLGIIGSSLGQVLYQKFNYAYNNNLSLYIIVKKILIKLLLLALPLFCILYFIAPDLFEFVFGEKWRIAGEYTRILLPYLFMNFLISPISQIPIILGKQKTFFYISLIGNISMPSLIFSGYKFGLEIENIFYLISCFFVIYLIFVLLWILKISRK